MHHIVRVVVVDVEDVVKLDGLDVHGDGEIVHRNFNKGVDVAEVVVVVNAGRQGQTET